MVRHGAIWVQFFPVLDVIGPEVRPKAGIVVVYMYVIFFAGAGGGRGRQKRLEKCI